MDSFKDQIKNKFLPKMKETLKKEEEHYCFLNDHKEFAEDSYFITSKNMIEHLKIRIKEYTDYIK